MRFRYGVLAGIAAALLLAACAAAPAPAPAPEPVAEPPAVVAPVVEAPAVEAPPAPQAEMEKVKERRAYILANGLDAYAPDPYKQAEDRFAAAEAAYGKDNDKSRAELAAALPLYEKTIADGFGKKVEGKRTAANAARAKADAEKAKVAAKEPYAAGDAAVTQAASDAKAGKFEAAITGYETAEKSFLDSAKIAAERRVKAREALDKAAATIDETDGVLKTLQEEMTAEEGGAQ